MESCYWSGSRLQSSRSTTVDSNGWTSNGTARRNPQRFSSVLLQFPTLYRISVRGSPNTSRHRITSGITLGFDPNHGLLAVHGSYCAVSIDSHSMKSSARSTRIDTNFTRDPLSYIPTHHHPVRMATGTAYPPNTGVLRERVRESYLI